MPAPGITLDGRDMLVMPPKYPSTEVKEELGGRWDKQAKAWRLPPTSNNVLRLEEFYGEDFIDAAPDVIRDLARLEWGFEGWSQEELARAEEHPAWETLYDFQREGVEYMCANPHYCSLLGLSPGLGKTPVSVVAAELLDLKKILILSPVILAKQWRREIEKWEESEFDVKRATADDRAPGAEVTVANHEVIQEVVLRDEDDQVLQPDWVTNARKVKEWIAEGPTKVNEKGKVVPVRERIVRVRRDYADIEWDAIIVDESILLKNRKAIKTFVLSELAKVATYVWMLSGSPTSKYNDDLFRQLQIMFPRGFSSYWRFAEQFCVVHRDQWGWSITGDRAGVDPKHYLRDFLFMRDQEDVLPDLPDYIRRPIEIDLSKRQRQAFNSMLDEWVVELEAADPDAIAGEEIAVETTARVGQMTRLQQITSNMGCLPKMDAKGEKTGEFYPRNSAKEDLLVKLLKKEDEIELPLLVWTWWVPTAHSIKERLEKEFKDLRVALVTGETKDDDERDNIIEAYKAGEYDVLILQMQTAKYGLTVTNTRTVFYHDRSFDADAWVQSLRRVRRIGLTHSPVLILPQCEGSADELVELNLLGKIGSISKLTHGALLELLQDLRV